MNTKPFTRLEDWLNVLAGVYLTFVPIMYATVTGASVNAYIMGPVIGLLGLAALAYPRARSLEWTQLLAAAWLFLAPWLLSFTGTAGAAWNAWIVAVLVGVLAVVRLVEQSSQGTSVRAPSGHLPHTA